jgi:hypothetical protein
MALNVMRKLRIGYWPLSPDLKAPGDRRRLLYWANARGHSVITDLKQKLDIVVASEGSDFNSPIFDSIEVPVIFDLIDAYLSPLNSLDDFARGIAKKMVGQISGTVKPYSAHVGDFCKRANAVICSSREQENVIRPYNANTHVILDSHEEIDLVEPCFDAQSDRVRRRILWEGQPATLGGVRLISTELAKLALDKNLEFNFVTDERYFMLMNRFFRHNTLDLINTKLSLISPQSKVISWSPQNLLKTATNSTAAMLPIDLTVPIQRLKPENRLLIMWRLGLPCLTSNSPAYKRVALEAGVDAICAEPTDWYDKFSRIFSDPGFALDEVTRGQNYLKSNHNGQILLYKWDLAFESVLN